MSVMWHPHYGLKQNKKQKQKQFHVSTLKKKKKGLQAVFYEIKGIDLIGSISPSKMFIYNMFIWGMFIRLWMRDDLL